MAELVLDPVIEKLSDVILEYLKDQVRRQKGMQEEVKKLRHIQPHIKAVMSAYRQVEIEDPALKDWYWQVRDAIDEADDVLDEIEYRKLEKQASKNKKTGKVRSLMKSIKKKVVVFSKRALKIDPYLERLEVAVQKLSEISAKVSEFIHLVDITKQEQQQQRLQLLRTRETGAMLGNDFFGRSNEITRVKHWLRYSYETQSANTTDLYRNISLLSVVGHGGMGKTTLLQRIYEDVTLNKDGSTEGFDVKMWACVSQNFDVQTVITNILKSLNENVSVGEPLHSLQSSLQSKVTSKRFLLVLDDIWEANEEKWRDVLVGLRNGNPRSKILISTRMDLVASMFAKIVKKDNEKLSLEGLEGKELLELFNTHAFDNVENPDDEFKSIAEKFVEKLLGSPLAAKVIGNFLNSNVDKFFWKKVLETNIGNIKPAKSGQNDLLSILKLSYIYLPHYLQNCFSFCCMFPQDYEFHKDDLVQMWIALSFIQSSNIQGETLEETGRRCFDFLIQRSFFDKFSTDDYQTYYKMHDLLHELAQSISMQECSRVVDDKKLSIPKTIRHLSIDTSSYEVSKEIEKFKHLRSLFLSFSVVDENVISQILKASKSLRLLVIDAPNNNYSVPEKIDGLIHLRYLKIDCWVLKLSRSISHLYHLQFVISKRPLNLVMDNISWEELRPNKNCHLIMDKLVIEDLNSVLLMEPQRSISYLRFLMIVNNDKLVSFPSETELWFLQHSSTLLQLKFQNLQSLQSLPPLSSFSFLTYLILHKIPLLKSLPDLPSSLKKLNLYNMESLESLSSSLSAIPSLETLQLNYIPLLKSLPDLPSSLKMLELYDIESLESLPSSLSAIPSLETLQLHYIPLLKSLPDLPSSLKKLKLYHIKSLESLPSSLSAIPSLETLLLHDIPLLKSLPDLPSSLKRLTLRLFESLESLPSSLSAIPSLKTLLLHDIPLLKSLPDLPSSLKMLELSQFESLESLPFSLSAIPSLETLLLHYIPLLKSLPDLPSSLKMLHLFDLESLKFLPSPLSAICSLDSLILRDIPLLKSLPDLPSSLKELKLYEFESLESLPSSLSAIPSLKTLRLHDIPLLKSLPHLPSSLKKLDLSLKSLESLPSSLSAITSLEDLELHDILLLKSLPHLPSSLEALYLKNLENLDCLPSCLPTRLRELEIFKVRRLLELPDLPASLEVLYIEECDPQLMERYPNFGSRRWRFRRMKAD